jgi:hypothetical protein
MLKIKVDNNYNKTYRDYETYKVNTKTNHQRRNSKIE